MNEKAKEAENIESECQYFDSFVRKKYHRLEMVSQRISNEQIFSMKMWTSTSCIELKCDVHLFVIQNHLSVLKIIFCMTIVAMDIFQ